MSFLVTILCRGCIVVVASRSSVVVVFHRGNNVLSSLCDFNKFILPSSYYYSFRNSTVAREVA